MVFSSATFLFLFLPFVLAIYWLIAKRLPVANLFLFLASVAFYTWGEAQYVMVLLVAIAVCYGFGRKLAPIKRDNDSNATDEPHHSTRQKILLGVAVALLLTLLGYFKYANFITDNLNTILAGFGFDPIRIKDVRLPLGISFFTFQAISYLVDVYRGHARADRGIFSVGLYISLFPQLVAGPIVRYATVDRQISERETRVDDIADGCRRFVTGLAKKLLIANVVGGVADDIFGTSTDQLSIAMAWVGVFCYALQIYFDFSAYSDMAIGLGRMFGFRFDENFNYPYISRSIQEFWRRWHISLSTWFRDYVYIPLGGSRRGPWRTSFNLALVFVLCGFWHGASWNFLIWGLLHGGFLALERIGSRTLSVKPPRIVAHLYVLLVVLVGWVFFRATDLDHALQYLAAMFGFGLSNSGVSLALFIGQRELVVIGIGVILSTPVGLHLVYAGHPTQSTLRFSAIRGMVSDGVLFVLLGLSVMAVAGSTYDPFIYFRF